MDFSIKSEVEPEHGLAVIRLGGEVDAYTSETVKETIVGLTRDGYNKLIFDLGQLSYLDSSGLGTLVGALKRTRERKGDVAIVTSERRWLRLFELTGLDKVLTLVPTLQEARKRLGVGASDED